MSTTTALAELELEPRASGVRLTAAPDGRFYVSGPGVVTHLVDADVAALLRSA